MHGTSYLRTGLTAVALFGLYVLLAGQASGDELVAGGATAAAATVLMTVMQRACGPRWVRPGRADLIAVVQGVAAVPGDVWRVGLRLLAPHPAGGGAVVQPSGKSASDDPARSFERRVHVSGVSASDDPALALAMWAVSLAPNRYLLAPVRGGRWLLHRLVP